MALTLTTVTGTVDLPTGDTPVAAQLIFTLTGWAKDGGNIFVEGPQMVAVDASGNFSVALQTTEDMPVLYSVLVSYQVPSLGKEIISNLGTISVPASGPVTLGNLLAIPAPVPSVPDALAQALAAAAQAKAAADQVAGAGEAADRAEDAAIRAEDARDVAIDSVMVDYKVAMQADLASLSPSTNETALVRDTMHIWRWSGSAWVDTGTSPLSVKVNVADLPAHIKALAPAQPRHADVRRGTIWVDLQTLTPPTGNPGNNVILHDDPMRYGGVIESVEIHARIAGTVKIAVWSRSGDTFTKLREVSLTVAVGYNDLPVGLTFQRGDYLSHQGNAIAVTGANGSGDDNLSSYLGTRSGADGATIVSPTVSASPVRHAVIMHITRTSTIGGGGAARPVLPDDLLLVVSIGSRNSLGFGDAGATAQIEDGLVQGWSSTHPLLPLTAANANGANGDAPFLAFAAAYKAKLRAGNVRPEDMAHQVVATQVASSANGTTIGTIASNQVPYLSTAAKRLMRAAEERRVGMVALLTDGDRESSQSTIGYTAGLQSYLDAMASAWTTVGGAGVPLILSWHFATFRQYRANVTLLQREFAKVNDNYVLVTPNYHLGFRNDRDLTQVGLRTLGAYFARAYHQIAVEGKRWEMLEPAAIEISGTKVIMSFNKSGLVFDTVTVPEQPAMGFSVKTASGASVTISAAEIVDGNRVVLSCSTPPGAGAKISYGDLNAVGMGAYTGQAGNLRDSAGTRDSFEGIPLHNWCALFDWTVPTASTPTVSLSQAAYDALPVKDPGTLYLITG